MTREVELELAGELSQDFSPEEIKIIWLKKCFLEREAE
jgi:hypothetical protein